MGHRPTNMYNIGDFYYPEGSPIGTSEPVYMAATLDADNKRFWICYTQSQFDMNVERNGGIFCPFIPFHSTDNII